MVPNNRRKLSRNKCLYNVDLFSFIGLLSRLVVRFTTLTSFVKLVFSVILRVNISVDPAFTWIVLSKMFFGFSFFINLLILSLGSNDPETYWMEIVLNKIISILCLL